MVNHIELIENQRCVVVADIKAAGFTEDNDCIIGELITN